MKSFEELKEQIKANPELAIDLPTLEDILKGEAPRPDMQSQGEECILTLPDDPRWREREEPEEDDDPPMLTEQKTGETPDAESVLPPADQAQGEDMKKIANVYSINQATHPVREQFKSLTEYLNAAREWEALHPKTPTPRRASSEQAGQQPAIS